MQILDGLIHLNEMNKHAMGGSELMTHALVDKVDLEVFEDMQIIVSRLQDELDDTKHKVYYLHDLPQDPASSHLADGGWENFHSLVFVSHWQRQAYINYFNIPWSKTTVLQNAIDPIEIDLETKLVKDKPINLVYHTTPHRGLELLVPVYEELIKKHDDVHLHVYSSFGVYGWTERDEQYKALFDTISNSDKMTLHSTLSNADMKKALMDMDIFAYPSIWPETSCISLMEAMSAGCMTVHPNYGALPETAANWTYGYDFDENNSRHASKFLNMLHNCIDLYREMPVGLKNRLQSQKSYTDLYYGWDIRKAEWDMFLRSVKSMPLELVKTGVPTQAFEYRTG